jgi:hypothetical protein
MFTRSRPWFSSAALAFWVLTATTASASAAGTVSAVSSENANLLTGGIGEDERLRLLAVSPQYELVASFARHSDGAMLSNVDVTLSGATLKQPIELTTSGPILLASLPSGHYVVTARLTGWKTRVCELDVVRHHNQRLYITFVPKSAP